MSVLIFFIISYLLMCWTLKPIFEKAGVEGKKAFIPGVNFAEWAEIIGRKRSYAWRLLIPIVNIFVFAGMAVDLVRSFKKYSFVDSALAVIYAPLSFFLLGKDEKAVYDGPNYTKETAYNEELLKLSEDPKSYEYKKMAANNPYKKTPPREWAESLIFAVFAAAFIRMFLIEAYVIPTPSMEGSLLVGDFLFVSKVHYGIRTPMTLAQVPLLHNRLPGNAGESYLESPSLDYFRLPALTSIKRNDPVVFNYPEGDSVFITPGRTVTIHDTRYDPYYANMAKGHKLVTRPMDKMDHYIKRCVAVGGDKIEIKHNQLFVNDKQVANPKEIQFSYYFSLNDLKEADRIFQKADVDRELSLNRNKETEKLVININNDQKIRLEKLGMTLTKVEHIVPRPLKLFPHDVKNYPNWTVDNYGPVTVPAKGQNVVLTPNNIKLYERAIRIYEGNKLEIKGPNVYINGAAVKNYTFKQDYYWMMGDNRHNSEDSRFWGFVPESHVVGKPLFIWFSTKSGSIFNGIRWNRLFNGATKFD